MKNPAIFNYNDNEERLADWEIGREASRGSSGGGGGYRRSRGSDGGSGGGGGSTTLYIIVGLVLLYFLGRGCG